MDQRVRLRSVTSIENNLTELPGKALIGKSPRKAFKDTTNSSAVASTPSEKPSKKIEQAEEIDDFNFPPEGNCYCCGDKKKTDIEVVMDHLVTNEFMKLLQFEPIFDDLGQSDEEPELSMPLTKPQPINPELYDFGRTEEITVIELKMPDLEFDDDFNWIPKECDDSGISQAASTSLDYESDNEMIIPSYDDLMSDDDDSMISAW